MITITVVFIIKNGENYINYLDQHFEEIEKKNQTKYCFEYFIYENNSKDNTKTAIEHFYKRTNRKGKYLLEDIDNNKDLGGILKERGEYMSFLRNKLKTFHGFLLSDYTLLLDADVVFSNDTITNMINTFDTFSYVIGASETNSKTVEMPTTCIDADPTPLNEQADDWGDRFGISWNDEKTNITVKRIDIDDGIWGQPLTIHVRPYQTFVALCVFDVCYECSEFENNTISMSHYYDSLAFISNKNVSYDNISNTCLFDVCLRCKKERIDKNKRIEDDLLISKNNIFNVNAAFGGFFLIKTIVYNQVDWDTTICEHHSFCKKIREYGDILLEPRINVITCPSNSNYLEIQQHYLGV